METAGKPLTDHELLRRYVESNAQDAFAQLAGRHVNWISSMAARLTHDRALADDVTQAVFLLLAQKAKSLRRETILSTWLFTVTRYASSTAMRKEMRRRAHERKAAAMREQAVEDSPTAEWQHLSPLLDELVGRLRSADRQAVLLRFYEQKSFEEIGLALQISEEAARKRVSRSIEKLRGLFASKNIAVGAAALAVALGASLNESASAGLIASSAAQGSAAAATGSGVGMISQGANSMMTWISLKTPAAVALGLLIAAGLGTVVLQLRPGNAAPRAAAGPTSAPTTNVAYQGHILTPDGKPISGANVYLVGLNLFSTKTVASTTTDAQGAYHFDRSADEASLIVYAPGYGLTGIDAMSGQMEISLRRAAEVRLHFTDPQGKPAAGLRIGPLAVADTRLRWQTLVPDELKTKLAQTTDANGDCILAAMPQNGRVQIDLMDPRYLQPPLYRGGLDTGGQEGEIWIGPAASVNGGVIRLELAGSISGKAVFANTGRPAPGVAVIATPNPGQRGTIVTSARAVTDAQGNYRLAQLDPIPYSLALEAGAEVGPHSNAEGHPGVVVVAGQDMVAPQFELTAGGVIRGKVVASESSTPLPNAEIQISGPSAPAAGARGGQNFRAAADGTFEIHVPPGAYYVRAVPPGPGVPLSRAEQQQINVEAGAVAITADFAIAPPTISPQSLNVRIIDGENKPVSGARVLISGTIPMDTMGKWQSNRPGNASNLRAQRPATLILSDAQGNVSMPKIPAGILLRAVKDDLVSLPSAVPPDDSTLTLKVQKDLRASLKVQVNDRSGLPVEGARVTLLLSMPNQNQPARGVTNFPPAGGRGIAVGRGATSFGLMIASGEGMVTGADGVCIFDDLDPSLSYQLNGAASGFLRGPMPLTDLGIQPGKEAQATIVIDRADSFIAGIVVDAEGRPQPGVAVVYGNGYDRKISTDNSGRFRLDGLVNGVEDRIAVQRGNFYSKYQLAMAGRDDLVLVNRPTASERRGIAPNSAVRDTPQYLADEEATAAALIAANATLTADAGRGTPIIGVRASGSAFTDEQVKLITQLRDIETVSLTNSAITDAGVAELKNLPQLSSLTLTGSGITDGAIKQLSGLRYLRALSFGSTALTDAAIGDLKNLPALQTLVLSSTKVTDAGMAQLAEMKNLTTLTLTNTGLTDVGLAKLAGLEKLNQLNIGSTKITGAGLKAISKMQNLTELDLARTGVADGSLGELAGLPRLNRLSLNSLPISDLSLADLMRLTKLRALDLRSTPIGDIGVAQLRQAIPGINIIR